MNKTILSKAAKRPTLEVKPPDVLSCAAEAPFSVPLHPSKVEADGVRVFYRTAGERPRRLFFCSMDSQPHRSCSANSFRASRTITA